MALYRAQYHAVSVCAICLDGMEKNLAALPCGHVFHHTCVNEALSFRRSCPVCRRHTSPQNAIPLFFNLGAGAANRGSSSEKAFHNVPSTRLASHLPEQLKEIRKELDRVYKIQRMTSSQSFRLQNDLMRRGQQLEQVTCRMQHIQHELDNTKTSLKRWQRIATTTYTQLNEAKRAKDEYEQKIRHTADRMLERIRERQHHRCPSCDNQWRVMKCAALEISSANGTLCCPRHGRRPAPRNMSRASPAQTLRQSRAPHHDPVDYDF